MVWRFPFRRQDRAQLAIRPLAGDLADECAKIHEMHFGRPWSSLEIRDLLRQSSSVGDAALDGTGKNLLGFAISRVIAPEAELLTIAVDRRRLRSGVGKALITGHLSRLAAAGAKDVFLEVDQGNSAALQLYSTLGFQQVGERKGYYRTKSGVPATALVMRAELG